VRTGEWARLLYGGGTGTVDLINRVGVVIPTESTDLGGDASRLESLGFGHAFLPHDSPTPILLALGATRRLRLLTTTGIIEWLQAEGQLPDASLGRLEAADSDEQPLPVDTADATATRAAIARRLASRRLVTVDLTGPLGPASHKLALDVLTHGLPGRSTTRLHAEDLTVGQTFDLGEHQLTEEDIVSFAQRFDPLDFHIDPQLAAATPIGVLCASGVHTQAILQRLNARGFLRSLAVVAGRGMLGMRLPKPVTPGLVLRGATEIIDVDLRPSGRAVVTIRSTLHGAGDLLLEHTGEIVVLQRDPASP
jgi:acyl dehydratase